MKRYADLIGNYKNVKIKNFTDNKNVIYLHTATAPEPEEDTFPIVSGNFQLNQEEV